MPEFVRRYLLDIAAFFINEYEQSQRYPAFMVPVGPDAAPVYIVSAVPVFYKQDEAQNGLRKSPCAFKQSIYYP